MAGQRLRAVIFVNGVVPDAAILERWLAADDYLICADGGTRHCLALDRLPRVVVGDLDSLAPETVAWLEGQGVAIERHPERKDQTDLELAIDRAIRDGATEVLLLGALGGRLDQTVANLLILARRDWPLPIALAEGDQLAQVLRAGETLTLDGAPGSLVSVVPLSEQVTGITYAGLEYPLHHATLRLGSTRGVSNVLAASPATIHIESGMLLVVTSGT
jgi:thiamine pyrophosphokinase